ncbi:MAG: hypothetical protein IKP47_04395 [Ruminococcus sp.]|nr:hypothetical protein [Ruminococcus sp.]
MDIIAEILETDRLAEESLAEAGKKCRELIESAENRRRELEASVSGSTEKLTAEAEQRCAEKRDAALAAAESGRNAEIEKLEQVFDRSREAWAQQIFERIVSV